MLRHSHAARVRAATAVARTAPPEGVWPHAGLRGGGPPAPVAAAAPVSGKALPSLFVAPSADFSLSELEAVADSFVKSASWKSSGTGRGLLSSLAASATWAEKKHARILLGVTRICESKI